MEGLQKLYECHPHQHQKMYMSWCQSINGIRYYECLYCKGILIDEEIDLEKIQQIQFGILQSRLDARERIIKEAKRVLKIISCLPKHTVRNLFDYEEIANKCLAKIKKMEKEK